jgi:hypothetical protein
MSFIFNATTPAALAQLKQNYASYWSSQGPGYVWYTIVNLINLWYLTSTINSNIVTVIAYYQFTPPGGSGENYYYDGFTYNTITGLYNFTKGTPISGPASATSNNIPPNYLAQLTLYYPIPAADICFPAGTPIVTDSGIIAIENLKEGVDTINGDAIVAITKTVSMDNYLVCFGKDSLDSGMPSKKTVMSKDHKVLYKGKMIEAYKFVGHFDGVKKVAYDGEVLYNVLLEEYGKMNVNNMICETLHPKNIIAKLHTNGYSEEFKNKIVVLMNDSISKKNIMAYKSIVGNL